MSNYFATADRVSAAIALAKGGTAVLQPGKPIDVLGIILVTTTAYTVANSTHTVAVRNADTTTSVTKGTYVVPFSGSALNKVLYIPMRNIITSTTGVDGSLVYTGAEGAIKVNPGQEIVITDGGQQTVGASDAYFEYSEQGFSGTRVAPITQLVFTAQ
jgi:hypothetical protein